MPNPSNVRLNEPMTEEQKKELKRAKARARYAKQHPIAKSARKDIRLLQPLNTGPPNGNQGRSKETFLCFNFLLDIHA